MSYTFNPIPAIDTINDHKGLVCIAIIMVVCFVLTFINNDGEYNMWRIFVVYSIPVAIAAGVSYNTGTYKEYANTKVEGTLVGFVAEGYRERSGKSYVDRHNTYVEYEIEGSRVLFGASTGITYPKTAIFYKN